MPAAAGEEDADGDLDTDRGLDAGAGDAAAGDAGDAAAGEAAAELEELFAAGEFAATGKMRTQNTTCSQRRTLDPKLRFFNAACDIS